MTTNLQRTKAPHRTASEYGILLSSDASTGLRDPAVVRNLVTSGQLVRLRRGAFVRASQWASADARERHVLRVRAVVVLATRPIAVSGISAAAVYGMPVRNSWPDDVCVLDRWKGGGRSEPGVRRTAAGYPTARVVYFDGLPITDIARTALDVARSAAFRDAMGSVDWALWRKNPLRISLADLAHELRRMHPYARRRHLEAVVAFATHLSDSFGESLTRAVIWELGFELPELQHRFWDRSGEMFSDFYWRSIRSAGEFDGKAKYFQDPGEDPGEVLWREKKRQDRLMALGYSVIRFTWNDVLDPRRMTLLLTEAGIPRRT